MPAGQALLPKLLGMQDAVSLRPFAKYIWWKTPEEAVSRPERLYAQVMDIGDYEDVLRLTHAVGEDALRRVLERAEAGQFNPRSWAYWHYRLGVVQPGEPVPEQPRRLMARGCTVGRSLQSGFRPAPE